MARYPSVSPNVHPLIKELHRLVRVNGKTLLEIGALSGVAPHTISEWLHGGGGGVVNFEAVLNALGYELKIVRRTQR